MENQQSKPEKQSIFRRKALDRISSPEELDQYLTVTGPGVWLPLGAVIVLLLGALAWMIFGQIKVTMNVAVVSDSGTAVCYVETSSRSDVLKGGTVTIAGKDYTLTDAGYAPRLVDSDMDTSIRMAGNLTVGTVVAPLAVDAELADGVYAGTVVVEAVHPIKYIIN